MTTRELMTGAAHRIHGALDQARFTAEARAFQDVLLHGQSVVVVQGGAAIAGIIAAPPFAHQGHIEVYVETGFDEEYIGWTCFRRILSPEMAAAIIEEQTAYRLSEAEVQKFLVGGG